MKTLIAYFSASGITKHATDILSQTLNCPAIEIEPEVRYTKADLNWMDQHSRSSIEMNDKTSRPAIKKLDLNLADVDTILIGFPIWWYIAPTIINTFLEAHDFSGKKIILFATSGGSGFGETVKYLQPSAPDALIKEGKVFSSHSKNEAYIAWAHSL